MSRRGGRRLLLPIIVLGATLSIILAMSMASASSLTLVGGTLQDFTLSGPPHLPPDVTPTPTPDLTPTPTPDLTPTPTPDLTPTPTPDLTPTPTPDLTPTPTPDLTPTP